MPKTDESLRESGEWILKEESFAKGSLICRYGVFEIYERVYTKNIYMGKFNDEIKVVSGYDVYNIKSPEDSSRYYDRSKSQVIRWARDNNTFVKRNRFTSTSRTSDKIKIMNGSKVKNQDVVQGINLDPTYNNFWGYTDNLGNYLTNIPINGADNAF